MTSLSFLFSFDHKVTHHSKFKPYSILVLGWKTKCKSISLSPTVFHCLLSAVSSARPGLPRWLSGKDSACQCRSCRDTGSIPGSGRSLFRGGRNGRPTQHSCLYNPMDRGTRCATFLRVAEESDMTEVTEHARKHARRARPNLTIAWGYLGCCISGLPIVCSLTLFTSLG